MPDFLFTYILSCPAPPRRVRSLRVPPHTYPAYRPFCLAPTENNFVDVSTDLYFTALVENIAHTGYGMV